MKIITVNNYEDFSSDFPVSQDILPPLTEKDFNLSGSDSKIKSRLFQLLISHKSAFARSTVELSAAATEHHRISLQHDYPIKCPIYKIPFNLRNEFRRQITDLEKAGIISKSNSQYNTLALFVKQKEKWRLVLDFRKLNEITLTQDFVIPSLDDILHEISGSNYFSALDMKSAFNQILLHFADRHKTAFSTPDGDKYEFNRLCFGLKNSPKAFQSIAQEVLGHLLHNGALVYIDDIILFTKTIDEHFELLVDEQRWVLVNGIAEKSIDYLEVENTNASENNDSSPRGRIDIQTPCILASFVEPLDALLEVDEIQDARSHFEDMVQHIVRTVQEHFHLQRPAGDRQTNGSSQLNTLDAQRFQQTYKWNRRKCIRAITDGATTRVPVGKEDTYNHFRAIWESPSHPVERTDVTPPPRSPVVDSLTPAFVESCLKMAENSSPGQDLITYRHWREIDPSCFILTKIFNICLKLADIPSTWKTSRTVLIHKKGDVG
ncbi:retrovirus-related Pol polyprotein from transposon 17.6 [Trichonephila clavipes]|nr:retrovirus-related Pol polyprotein from transposon 17.6 [Trichonephila clavipes]